MGSASGTRTYTGQPLPQGALGEFFQQVRAEIAASGRLADQRQLSDLETVKVSITHSGGINEHAEWPLDRLFAVTDLSDGNPSSVTFPASPGSYIVEVNRTFGATQLIVVVPSAEEAAAILTLGDQYFSIEPLSAAATHSISAKVEEPTKAAKRVQAEVPARVRRLGGVLDWMEHHPLYRVLVIVSAVIGGIGVVIGALLWAAKWVGVL